MQTGKKEKNIPMMICAKQCGPKQASGRIASASESDQWCQNNANRRMIGSGIPMSHSNKPRPNVMIQPPLRHVGEATR
jgi:hypothetical protein